MTAAFTPGLRANWRQFTLLMLVNAFVGSMVGLERAILPLLAEAEFGLASTSAALSFLIGFGVVKALANLAAGRLADRVGRKRVLVAGWLAGLPVPMLLIVAPTWGWVVFANALLGINQGLSWSATITMKIDLAGERRRGLAMGLNESAGYVAVSLTAMLSGYLATRFGLRPVPFYPGLLFAGLGLLLSTVFVRETLPFARHEAHSRALDSLSNAPFGQILLRSSWKERNLLAANQAGLVNNLNDGVVWGLVPIFLAGDGLPPGQIALIAAVYPLVWGLAQLATGALSDRLGRKPLIVAGMWVQAVSIGALGLLQGFEYRLAAASMLGVGTALVYPTLLAAVSDAAHPDWRATAVGIYRLWRDGGFAVGALTAGLIADTVGIPAAIIAVAGLTFLSGVFAAVTMTEGIAQTKSF